MNAKKEQFREECEDVIEKIFNILLENEVDPFVAECSLEIVLRKIRGLIEIIETSIN